MSPLRLDSRERCWTASRDSACSWGKWGAEAREEAKRTARDAAFLALVATLCALIAYMATEDFLEKFSTIRFLATCAIGLVAAKIIMLFNSRMAKFSGIFLTITILAGAVLFITVRFRLWTDPTTGLAEIGHRFTDPKHVPAAVLAVIVAILVAIAGAYPFTIAEWRRLVTVSRSDNSAAPKARSQPA